MLIPTLLLVQVLQLEGTLTRTAPERVSLLRFSSAGGLLGCQSTGKAVELFRSTLQPLAQSG
jgi:hypothetical protein